MIEWYSNVMPDEKLYIDTVRELIEVRDGRKVIAKLDRTELMDLLECLCIFFFQFFMFYVLFVVLYALCFYCANTYIIIIKCVKRRCSIFIT